jgi:tetratricopeptide (TPR) repeat protein
VNRRTRVFVVVAVAAIVAAGAAIGAALLLGDDEEDRAGPRPGYPPLVLDLGVRTDAEAIALRRAERLYADDKQREAGTVFARYDSAEAQIGSALAAWPGDAVARLERLADERPRDARVLLHLGFAHLWAGRDDDAVDDWRRAARVEPDSPSAGVAEDLLHPNFPRGRPLFVPNAPNPPGIVRLAPPAQLAELARRARAPDVRAKLRYGVALQRLGRRLSAQRQFDAAARLAPNDPEAQVAAAVVRFDKARPSAAFARLGPLSRRFPQAQSVRFHLGLLLFWLARVEENAVAEGTQQLRRARDMGPETTLGREAKRLLDSLENVETG